MKAAHKFKPGDAVLVMYDPYKGHPGDVVRSTQGRTERHVDVDVDLWGMDKTVTVPQSGLRLLPGGARGAYRRNAKGYDPKVKDVLYMDEIADLLGFMGPDKFSDAVADSAGEVYGHALRHLEHDADATAEEHEELALQAEQAYLDEEYSKYRSAAESVANHVFGEHGLALTELKKGGYKIAPETSWRDAAFKIVDTINGVGYFHFSSLKDFLGSGPYTPREAVLSHLGYLKRRSEVYGDPSPERLFERAMR